jgi:type III pantothenate kinase
MLLCDIGNTSYHFLEDAQEYKESAESFDPQTLKEKVYYISVNEYVSKKLELLNNWIDISSFINKEQYYESMGIDRVVAISGIKSGVVIDAGSAITVDVVRDGIFEGGFIYPGLKAMQETYKKISPALDYEFNFDIDLKNLAKNSQDAISYGVLKLLFSEVNSHNLPIILTGGDASSLKKLFSEASIDEKLIFKGMKEIIAQGL